MPRRIAGIIAQEGVATGDSRIIEPGALTWGAGPWPLRWQPFSAPGHSQSLQVGAIERIWRDGQNIRAEGALSDSRVAEIRAAVDRFAELAEIGTVGVSVGFDDEAMELRVKKEFLWWMEEDGEPPPRDITPDRDGRVRVAKFSTDDLRWHILSGRIREVTGVDTGAIVDAAIVPVGSQIGLAAAMSGPDPAFADPHFGADDKEDPRLVWQPANRPDELSGWGCPLTIADDGRVFGHVALRTRCHGAFAACIPPPGNDDFANFLIGEATPGVATGPIILDTDHGVDEQGRVKSHTHLADTGRSVADAAVGSDRHGVWIAGRLRPGLTAREKAALKGSTLSGEWHPIGGRLRLVGVLAVNSPGYLVRRRGLAAGLTLGATACCDDNDDWTVRLDRIESALADLYRLGVA